jgi:hypothetical protein
MDKILRLIVNFESARANFHRLDTGLESDRDPAATSGWEVEQARVRSRQLHRDGLLYSSDFPQRYGEVIGEDGVVTAIAGIC